MTQYPFKYKVIKIKQHWSHHRILLEGEGNRLKGKLGRSAHDKLIGAFLLPASHRIPTHIQPGNGEKLFFTIFQVTYQLPLPREKKFPTLCTSGLFWSPSWIQLNHFSLHLCKTYLMVQMSAYSCPEKLMEEWQTWAPSITHRASSAFSFLSQLPFD